MAASAASGSHHWIVPVEARGLMEAAARDFDLGFGTHRPTNSPDNPWGLSDVSAS